MKITRLETLRLGEFPNLAWVRVHTDEGLSGTGETAFAAAAVEAYLHEYIAPRVLGRNPMEIERLTRGLTGYLGFRGSGVETRAIDIEVSYGSFDEYWSSQTGLVNPIVQAIRTMLPGDLERLKTSLRSTLSARDGRISYPARANAVKGRAG